MRWNTFSRSLLFAALAAAGFAPWWIVTAPLLGGTRAMAVYLVLVTAAYLGGLAADLHRRVVTFLVTALVASGIAFLARSLAEEALGLAVLIATVRSVFLYRAPAPRAVIIEVLCIGAGLLFARFLAGPSLAGTMLSLWAFFLVQSLFFLVGGIDTRQRTGRHPDPFEEACRRAAALLDVP